MKKNTPIVHPDRFYHIYNRGINGEDLFKEPRNFYFFLSRLATCILPVAEVYAYCLLRNHFHLCIRTRPASVIVPERSKDGIPSRDAVFESTAPKDGILSKDAVFKTPEWHISNRFATLFKSYAQAINKAFGRTGGLFEEPFRRIEIQSDSYLSWLIYYIHANPQLHGFTGDFTRYPHSSYNSLLQEGPTRLSRAAVLDFMGGRVAFEDFHRQSFPDDMLRVIQLE